MKKLNLQQFAGSLTVTVYKDAGMTTASASPSSSLAKNDTVTLTLTPATGYELDEVEVVQGGVTIEEDDGTYSFKMGETDVVLNVKSKGAAMYKIVENTQYSVNGTAGSVTRNMTLVKGKNGQIIDVSCEPTDLSSVSADVLAALVASGAAVKV